jgi:hypothetical protein
VALHPTAQINNNINNFYFSAKQQRNAVKRKGRQTACTRASVLEHFVRTHAKTSRTEIVAYYVSAGGPGVPERVRYFDLDGMEDFLMGEGSESAGDGILQKFQDCSGLEHTVYRATWGFKRNFQLESRTNTLPLLAERHRPVDMTERAVTFDGSEHQSLLRDHSNSAYVLQPLGHVVGGVVDHVNELLPAGYRVARMTAFIKVLPETGKSDARGLQALLLWCGDMRVEQIPEAELARATLAASLQSASASAVPLEPAPPSLPRMPSGLDQALYDIDRLIGKSNGRRPLAPRASAHTGTWAENGQLMRSSTLSGLGQWRTNGRIPLRKIGTAPGSARQPGGSRRNSVRSIQSARGLRPRGGSREKQPTEGSAPSSEGTPEGSSEGSCEPDPAVFSATLEEYAQLLQQRQEERRQETHESFSARSLRPGGGSTISAGGSMRSARATIMEEREVAMVVRRPMTPKLRPLPPGERLQHPAAASARRLAEPGGALSGFHCPSCHQIVATQDYGLVSRAKRTARAPRGAAQCRVTNELVWAHYRRLEELESQPASPSTEAGAKATTLQRRVRRLKADAKAFAKAVQAQAEDEAVLQIGRPEDEVGRKMRRSACAACVCRAWHLTHPRRQAWTPAYAELQMSLKRSDDDALPAPIAAQMRALEHDQELLRRRLHGDSAALEAWEMHRFMKVCRRPSFDSFLTFSDTSGGDH